MLGIGLRRLIPPRYLSSDTVDSVKLATGLVATMAALLLGLLVSSAKGTYDTERNQVIQMAAKVAYLDRMLEIYGPESREARKEFRMVVEDAIGRVWPEGHGQPSEFGVRLTHGESFYAAIFALVPRDDMQRSIKTQATTVAAELGHLRTLLVAESVSSISFPLLVTVVCWLMAIFLSFSALAPSNIIARGALFISVISVSGAIFLILELDRPFGGLIQISSEPLQNALKQLAPPASAGTIPAR